MSIEAPRHEITPVAIVAGGTHQVPEPHRATSQVGHHQPVGSLLFQPIVLRHLWRGLYAKSADATWAIHWRNGSSTTLPLSFGLGYVILRQGWSPMNVFLSGEWMAYRHDAPVAAQTTSASA